VSRIDRLLKEASDKNRDDVERCERYLEACSEAIRLLEQEYDEILVQAKNLNETPNELQQFRERIDKYLHVDRLRPKFSDAISGLSYYQGNLKRNSERFLEWPWKKADTKLAANEFSEVLEELHTYLKKLDEQDLPYRPAGTGVGQEALHKMLNLLSDPVELRTKSLREVAEKNISERNKEPLFEYVKRIRLLIERLRHAFR
jgi:hypothetical protein